MIEYKALKYYQILNAKFRRRSFLHREPKHTLVSEAASVAMFKGAMRPKFWVGAKAAAEPTVARKATVENFIFNFNCCRYGVVSM